MFRAHYKEERDSGAWDRLLLRPAWVGGSRRAPALDAATEWWGRGTLANRESIGGKPGMNGEDHRGMAPVLRAGDRDLDGGQSWKRLCWCPRCCIAHGPGVPAHSRALWKSALNASILARPLAS